MLRRLARIHTRQNHVCRAGRQIDRHGCREPSANVRNQGASNVRAQVGTKAKWRGGTEGRKEQVRGGKNEPGQRGKRKGCMRESNHQDAGRNAHRELSG